MISLPQRLKRLFFRQDQPGEAGREKGEVVTGSPAALRAATEYMRWNFTTTDPRALAELRQALATRRS